MGFFTRSEKSEPVKTLSSRRFRSFAQSILKRFAYDAVQSDGVNFGWSSGAVSADQVVKKNLDGLRSRSREQYGNNEYLRHAVKYITNNVVGHDGIKFQSRARGRDYKADQIAQNAIEETFAEWSRPENCSLSGAASFSRLQHQIMESRLVDGEAFIRIHTTGPYGMQLEIIDTCLIDIKYNEDLKNNKGVITSYIRFGIEYDLQGRETAFYIRKNPGRDSIYGQYEKHEFERVPAKNIIHIWAADYVGQRRGFPHGSTALASMKLADDYENHALNAAKHGAALNVIAEVTDEKLNLAYDENTGAMAEIEMMLDSGQIAMVPEGFGLKNMAPEYPHAVYDPFMKRTLRRIAVGLGLCYNTLTSDLGEVNYSSMKVGRQAEIDMFKTMQQWLIEGFLDRIFREWIERQHALGTVVIKGKPLNREIELYRGALWQPRKWESLDPGKDASAREKALSGNYTSISAIIRESGRDPVEVFREIAEERELMEELGITPSMEETTDPTTEEKPPEDTNDPKKGEEEQAA